MSVTTNVTTIRTIANSITVFADSRSVPKIIGMGPMNRTPAPRDLVPPPWDLATRRIMAMKARMMPKITRANPIWFNEMSAKPFTAPGKSEISREL